MPQMLLWLLQYAMEYEILFIRVIRILHGAVTLDLISVNCPLSFLVGLVTHNHLCCHSSDSPRQFICKLLARGYLELLSFFLSLFYDVWSLHLEWAHQTLSLSPHIGFRCRNEVKLIVICFWIKAFCTIVLSFIVLLFFHLIFFKMSFNFRLNWDIMY